MRLGTVFDLVVRGGSVVTPEGVLDCDVAVSEGRIAQLGIGLHGTRELDATASIVVPGGIDMHVHLSAPAVLASTEPFVDDFASGSRAAIAGGVTTFGQMSFREDEEGQTLASALERDLAACREQAAIDYVLHPSAVKPDASALEEIAGLAAQGYTSLKLVVNAMDWNAGEAIIRAVEIAGDTGLLSMLHCEDEAVIDFLGRRLVESGRGGLENYPDSRPDYTERAAVERAIAIGQATGAPIYIVHLSSAAALASVREARGRGLRVSAETRPLYLHLTREAHAQADGGKYVGMPPLREQADVDALWEGLADGSIDTLASDHAPWLLKDKIDPALDVLSSRKGVADLETFLPLLYSEGVRRGRLGIERFVEVTATNPARLFGLYPRKGVIAVGSDADLVVLDPGLRRTIDGGTQESNADYSVYEGREVHGWPRYTVSRGTVVLEDGVVTATPGRGRWLNAKRVP